MGKAMLFELIGGLGMFLYGMQLMGDGLQKAAGDRMRRLLALLTTNPLLGVLVGALVTAVIQSSSATTVIVVGFINSGLMTLHQAVGVIMGAAIGTTMTAQLIAFKLTDYALPAIGIGMILTLFSPKRQLRHYGLISLGFGLLFLGMKFMTAAMQPLQEMPVFTMLMTEFSQNPILGVLAGAALTAVVQSSSATIGILQALAGYGLVSLNIALPILFGDNIGTTATALLASIGTTVAARRAAVFHLFFKIFGTLLFLPVLPVYVSLVKMTSDDIIRQIANAHTIFNVTVTILTLPFIRSMVRLVERIVPGEEIIMERGLKFLDRRIMNTPSIAIVQVVNELGRMAKISHDSLKCAMDGFLHGDTKQIEQTYQHEEIINELERDITAYLVTLLQKSMTERQSEKLNGLLNAANDIERIGDLSINIAELAEHRIEHNLAMSEIAVKEMTEMAALVQENILRAKEAMEKDEDELVSQVLATEQAINQMEKDLRRNHMDRLNRGVCMTSSGVVYLDVISNLERIDDHVAHLANIMRGQIY
ncbi:MAG: Na/Pi cotransporter family protein [bacterium]|jgi:phosphate:Na+ symporter